MSVVKEGTCKTVPADSYLPLLLTKRSCSLKKINLHFLFLSLSLYLNKFNWYLYDYNCGLAPVWILSNLKNIYLLFEFGEWPSVFSDHNVQEWQLFRVTDGSLANAHTLKWEFHFRFNIEFSENPVIGMQFLTV